MSKMRHIQSEGVDVFELMVNVISNMLGMRNPTSVILGIEVWLIVV